MNHAFGFGFFDFFQRRRHFLALFQADQVHFARAHAQRGERDIHHFFGGDGGHVSSGGRLRSSTPAGVLPDHFARRRTRHVHGHVAAADHNHFLADGELVAEVHVQQEIDALVDAIQINPRNGEIAAAMRAHGDQHGVEALAAQIGNGEIPARRVIELERDVAGLENLPHLRFHHVAGQTVFGNAEIKHSAGYRRGFKNRDRVAHQGQVVRCGKSHRRRPPRL